MEHLGVVVGRDGAPGAPGKDGLDGLGFEDMEESIEDDGRVLVRRYSVAIRLRNSGMSRRR